MAVRYVEEIEAILDTFLCTLHSTASAVTSDRCCEGQQVLNVSSYCCCSNYNNIPSPGTGNLRCRHNWSKCGSLPEDCRGHDSESWISAGIAMITESPFIVE